MRSETLRTFSELLAFSASEILSPWLASIASQVTSTTTLLCKDSTTSSAVIVAPASVMIEVIAETGLFAGSPSTRIVIPYPGLVDAISTQLHTIDRQRHQVLGRYNQVHLIFHLARQ